MRRSIRRATPSDLEAIVRFNLALARETEDRALDESTLRAGVAALLADDALGRYYLAVEAPPEVEASREGEAPRGGEGPDRAIGQLMVTREFSDWRNGPIWWIQSVYVDPAHRGRGLYRALHEYVRERAREAGAVGLRLYVDRDNRPAQGVYRALGMERARYDMYEEIWG